MEAGSSKPARQAHWLVSLVVAASLIFISWQPAPNPLSVFIKDLLARHQQLHTRQPERQVYLNCDKTLYEPGEVIWFSVYNRLGIQLMPATGTVVVELVGPNGTTEASQQIAFNVGQRQDPPAIASGSFSLKPDQTGGLYKLKATIQQYTQGSELQVFEKEVQVQNVVLPRLKLNLDFEQKAYGPGSTAAAKLRAFTNENRPLAGTAFSYVVSLDGKRLQENTGSVNSQGEAVVRFELPANLATTDGLLTLQFLYEGINESVTRSIPIVLNKVELAFFPEGGDLVEGLESALAFRALNEFQKPADVRGEIVDEAGKKVAAFESFHDGMGEVRFLPMAGHNYQARISSPAGISATWPLPQAAAGGYVLEVAQPAGAQIVANIKSTVSSRVALLGQMRGKVWFEKVIEVKPGDNPVQVNTTDFPMGTLQLTLFDNKYIERAERLVFVNAQKQLRVSVKPDKEKYLPREKVRLAVSVQDEQGLPMPADLSLAVVDDQLLSFADDKSSTILSWMLVESAIRGKVHEPAFYFNPKEPKAPRALDLLLKTAGWRRFTWAQVQQEQLPQTSQIPAGPHYQLYEPVHAAAASVRFPGKLQGKVIDASNKEEVPLANVIVKFKGTQKGGAQADLEGRYVISPLNPGSYDVEISFVGYQKKIITGVTIIGNQTRFLNVELAPESQMLQEVQVVHYVVPIIDKDNTTTGGTITREDLRRMPSRGTPSVKQSKAKVFSSDDRGDVTIKGTREAQTQYYVNGVKQTAAAVPVHAISLDNAKVKGDFMEQKAAPGAPAHDYNRVREFAAPVYEKAEPAEQRTDFRTTLFWKPLLHVDRTGKATVEFYNADNISSYNILVEGISADGTPGRSETKFFTQLPVSLAAKLPVTTVAEDKVTIPLVLRNNTAQSISGKLVLQHPGGWQLLSKVPALVAIAAQSSQTLFLEYRVLGRPGTYEFAASLEGSSFRDGFRQEVQVEHKGYPVNKSVSGSELSEAYEVDVSGMVAGTLQMQFTAYPTMLTDLLKGVEGMLREPYGCFEQTSSSTYPNVLVLDYLRQEPRPDATAMARAEALLDKGYKRLITFETPQRGYEWFGAAPGHEALTAYGLLQFTDMQRIGGTVDATMLARTREWLLRSRDGKGGFRMKSHGLHTYGQAKPEINNAYITYSLAEAGYKELDQELNAAFDDALLSRDPYRLALGSNALFASGDRARGQQLLNKLLERQAADGSFTGTLHSVTVSTGQSFTIETTSLAILAMLKSEQKPLRELQSAVKFLTGARSGYGAFGSTQGTVLALKALTAYAKFSKRTQEDGQVVVLVNGRTAGEQRYAAGHTGEISLTSLQEAVQAPGKQHIQVQYQKTKNPLPYSLAVDYYTALPPSSKDCKVRLQTTLADSATRVGSTVRYSAKLRNTQQEGLPSTMALLGIPAGLSVQPWQLKELQEKQVIDYYEIKGNRLACYFRDMAPGEEVVINLDLKAEFPGSYEAPASSAYLYYTNEYKDWAKGLHITVRR